MTELRSLSVEPGYAFPLGPKDACLAAVMKNHNPGPGTHNFHVKEPVVGDHKTMGLPEIEKPLFDNGVPAPNTYQLESNYRIPSFKIMKDSELN